MSSKKTQKGKILKEIPAKDKETQKRNAQTSKITEILMLASLGVFIVLITTYKIQGDDDIFWHLAAGKYITETKTVPSSDIFGFATAGEKWFPFSWGWEVLTYSVYSFSGYTGISILRTLIFLLIFFLYYKILMKFKISKSIFVLLSILLVFGIFERLSPRPQLISYLFFVLILYLIVEQRYFKRENVKILFFMPPVFLVWGNMHIGLLSGIAVFLIYCISEALLYFYPRKFSDGEITPLSKKNLLTLFAVFISSILILLVNPFGFQPYAYAYSSMQMNAMNSVNEWLSPFHKLYLGRPVNVIYIVFLINALLILYYSVKRKNIFAALITIVFAVYSTRNVRFSVDYLFIIFVFFVLAVDYLINLSRSAGLKSFLFSSNSLKIVLAFYLIILIGGIASNKLYITLRYIRATGFGIDGYFYPVKMIDFIKQNDIENIGSRPFNSYENGGYFIWNLYGKKDFIDSRDLSDNIIDEFKSIEMKYPGFEQKLKNYRFDYIVWSYPDIVMYPQYMGQAVISYLISKPDEWKLIFWDDNSFLFVKNEEKFKDLVSKYEYKYVNPYNFFFQRKIIDDALRTNPAAVKQEINRKYNEDPSGTFIKTIYNAYYTKIR